jgi:polyisoprenoid-binding protein YceI
MLKKISLILMTSLLLAPLVAFAETYEIDTAHSQIHFKITHLMISTVRGSFTEYSGTVDVDTANKTLTSAQAVISTASIDTRNQKRDDHLRSADFFEVSKYPEIRFVSKKISGSGSDITVVGDLTIKGITKEVTLTGAFIGAVTGPWGKQRAAFEASGKIDRKDFGLTWNKLMETGGLVVGDEVEIGLEIQAIKK